MLLLLLLSPLFKVILHTISKSRGAPFISFRIVGRKKNTRNNLTTTTSISFHKIKIDKLKTCQHHNKTLIKFNAFFCALPERKKVIAVIFSVRKKSERTNQNVRTIPIQAIKQCYNFNDTDDDDDDDATHYGYCYGG